MSVRLLLFILLVSFGCSAQNPSKTSSQFPGADSLLNFIQKNKDKTALYIQEDGKPISWLNENKLTPLASTMKILVAVEFAKQIGAGVFTRNQKVALKELDKYYVANTDGDAHPQWLQYERLQKHITNDSISLIDVARGMILFSSNANTEYLMDLLGTDNINSNIKLLGLKQHTIVYPPVASLFIYQNPFKNKEDKVLKQIRIFPDAVYNDIVLQIHNQLYRDPAYKAKFRQQDLTEKMQKLWSDRLPSSTALEYVKICQALNNRSYFDKATYAVLPEVLEMMMENPANKQWITHAGSKGGSTGFVLTEAFYATLKTGKKYEFALFFNNLQPGQPDHMAGWINDFRLALLTDAGFRSRLPY